MINYLKANKVARNDSHKELVVHFNHMPTDLQLAEFASYVLTFEATDNEVVEKIRIARALK